MTKLPNPTIDKIYQDYESHKEERRIYLGGSQLGEECCRRLWYSFRWAHQEKFEGRIIRLFHTGHREESRIIGELRNIGCTVHDLDSNGQQFGYTACDGHLAGHIDGVIEGLLEAPRTPHLLECKTSNQKGFDQIEKDGCEKAKPVHYAQMQLYMGLAELTRAAYIVQNKNTDELYMERIEAKPAEFKSLLAKASRIIHAETAPEKIGRDASFYKCKFCYFSGICHGTDRPEISCRTCIHSSPAKEGKWECSKSLPMDQECLEHLIIPCFLENWAEPTDGTPEWVRYKLKDGREFFNCASTGFPADDIPHYSSREIAAVQIEAIGDPKVEMARSILGGTIVKK